MTAVASPYETLGVDRHASAEDVRSAYLKLVKEVHPDHGGNAALFRAVQEAYEQLSDPLQRAALDTEVHAEAPAGTDDAASSPGPTGDQGAPAGSEGPAWPAGHDRASGSPGGQGSHDAGPAAPPSAAPAAPVPTAPSPTVQRRAPAAVVSTGSTRPAPCAWPVFWPASSGGSSSARRARPAATRRGSGC